MDQAKRAGHWSEEAREGCRPFKPLVLGSNPSALILVDSLQWSVDSEEPAGGQVFALLSAFANTSCPNMI
jgi:hypothetical protein